MISEEKKRQLSMLLVENVDIFIPIVHHCINYEKSPRRIRRAINGLENWISDQQDSWVQNRREGIEELIEMLEISREYRIAKRREKYINLSVTILIGILFSGCVLYVYGVFY